MMQPNDRSLIPAGMSTILPETASRVRRLEATLLDSLDRWGYQEIIPPTFEYLDVLSAGLEPKVIEQCYTFPDRTTGRILLLRPDVTAQIARIVAMGMVESTRPVRLCYRTTVFRYEPEHVGREREIFQVGAELIGADDVAMDAEIIALMINCLRRLGLSSFRISVGHVGFFKALLARSGMSAEGQKRAEHAAARKDLPHLAEILGAEQVPSKAAKAILEAPGLYGGQEVLDRGRTLAGGDRALRASLQRLTDVYRLLNAVGLGEFLLVDLGEFRGFDYYDGLVFDVFAAGIGCELGGGGRYNHLIGRFGRHLPSTGFAFDVDRLFRVIERGEDGRSGAQADFFIVSPVKHSDRVFRVAQMLRDSGLRAIQGTLDAAGPAGLRRALEAGRLLAASTVVVLGIPGVAPEEALVLSEPGLRRGRPAGAAPTQRKVKIKDLPTLHVKN
jgi:ATP phosphoribosyltransferase regulatory subunit